MDKNRDRADFRQRNLFNSIEEAHKAKERDEVPVEVRPGVFKLMNRAELVRWLEGNENDNRY